MYPVLGGYELPETDGFRYHSDIPQENANIEITRINEYMTKWLDEWKSSTE